MICTVPGCCVWRSDNLWMACLAFYIWQLVSDHTRRYAHLRKSAQQKVVFRLLSWQTRKRFRFFFPFKDIATLLSWAAPWHSRYTFNAMWSIHFFSINTVVALEEISIYCYHELYDASSPKKGHERGGIFRIFVLQKRGQTSRQSKCQSVSLAAR